MNYSSIYNKLCDFSFDDYDTFLKSINNSYNGVTKKDYVIDNNNTPVYNISSLTKDNLHDSFAISFDNEVKFDCLMTPYNKNNCNSLFVIFSGARSVKNDQLPIFKRWSYYPFIDSAVLNIADPMFYKFENLSLGWYYGTPTVSYIEYVSVIIDQICNILGIPHNNLFMFGSSGGGYVALQLSMYINNATHIAINPQISIDKFYYSKEFIKQTGFDLKAYDPHRRNDTLNVIKEKILSKDSKFLILQNLQDREDCENHFFPLLKSVGINKIHFGLNNSEQLLVWLYSCVGGHFTQGDQIIFSHIIYLAQKLSRSEKITDFDQYLFKNIGFLWRQIENYKASAQLLSKKIENAKECLK